VQDAPSDDYSNESVWWSGKGRSNEVRAAPIQIAVAMVKKINLQEVFPSDAYYSFEDDENIVNKAAQYFARYLHDEWAVGSAECGQTGILIFISVMDRVCFISTGAAVMPILPWWRLERVITNMKPDLRNKDYNAAILHAINMIAFLLEDGPPTLSDRVEDFLERFGVVIGFALFTFLFASWGEYRDRRKRWVYTEARSRLTQKEVARAKMLQKEYHINVCPICLEEFPRPTTPLLKPDPTKSNDKLSPPPSEKPYDLKSEESVIAEVGSDGQPIKLLRCGHVFCECCWKCWVNSGQGNPCMCPVCRRDVGRKLSQRNIASSVQDTTRTSQNDVHSTDNNNNDTTGTTTSNDNITTADDNQPTGTDTSNQIRPQSSVEVRWRMTGSNHYGTFSSDIASLIEQNWPVASSEEREVIFLTPDSSATADVETQAEEQSVP